VTISHPEESSVAYLMQVHLDAKERKVLDRQSQSKIVALSSDTPDNYTGISYPKGHSAANGETLLPTIFKQFPNITAVWIVGRGWVQRP